jgi:isopentenyl-diphosphate delta-isomerase
MITKQTPNIVTLVDSSGAITGYSEKIEAHLQGYLHLAFSLMIVRHSDNGPEYLLQQRAFDKYHSGGKWANTCCSHPLPNEKVEVAAQRRVYEELGVECILPMLTIGQISYKHPLDNNMIEHEFDNIIIAKVDELTWHKNLDEVNDVKWWSQQDILDAMKTNPSMFTAWFAEVFEFIMEYLNEETSDQEKMTG